MRRRTSAPPPAVAPPSQAPRWPYFLATAAVVLAAVMAAAPAVDNGFVDLDDEEAFVTNPHFRGLGAEQIRWAFETHLLGAYQPLGWFAYEAEYAGWGLDPRGYHLASIALHAAVAASLLALTATLLTRAVVDDRARRLVPVASGIAVAIFAAHPLRAEAVAWVTCQTYLPCALFAILSTLAYVRSGDEFGTRRMGLLAASWCLFAASLGSHAVPMGLPLVFLVLDVFPLRRIGSDIGRSAFSRRVGAAQRNPPSSPSPAAWWVPLRRTQPTQDGPGVPSLLLEKVPFVLLSLGCGLMAIRARMHDEGVASLGSDGVGSRLALACHSTWFYLIKTAWPDGLRACYAMPSAVGLDQPRFALAAAGVAALAAACWRLRRRASALAAAAACYGIILLPNSGVVRNISVLAADRYAYLATMAWVPALAGLILWGATRWRVPTAALIGGSAVAVALLGGLTREQCRTWHDSASVWRNALAGEGRPDAFMLTRLGRALAAQGDAEGAEAALNEALRVDPSFVMAHDKLGLVLVGRGQIAEAAGHFAEAVRLRPGYVEARMNLGFAHARRNQPAQAEAQFREALRIQPDFAAAHANLGAVLAGRGADAEAAGHFAEAARIEPTSAEARKNLGYARTRQGRWDEAAAEFAEAVRLDPADPAASTNLGYALARLGRPEDAAARYREALRLDPASADARRGLDELARGGSAVRR